MQQTLDEMAAIDCPGLRNATGLPCISDCQHPFEAFKYLQHVDTSHASRGFYYMK